MISLCRLHSWVRPVCCSLAVAIPAVLSPATSAASGTADAAPPITAGPVTWVLPASPAVKPQTEEEKRSGQQAGRTLPMPEPLQPVLDEALSAYVPTPGLSIDRHVVVACSDVLPGLVEAWAAGFRKHFPGFSLEIRRPLAGSLGARELIKGSIVAVFVSRELKPTDITDFRARYGYDPISIPVSGGSYRHFGFLDSLAFMVNRDNPIERLSLQQLDALLSSTRLRGGQPVRTWGDLGLTGEWANQPVHVYGIKPWNGIEEFVRQRVLSVAGKRGEWRKDMHFDPTFFPLARRVAADRYAIGYTGMSVVDSAVKVIQIGGVDQHSYVAPTYEAVALADYPLSRLVYLNANRAPGQSLDPALREFLRFILSRDGQAIVRRQAIFLPLRAWQVKSSAELLGN